VTPPAPPGDHGQGPGHSYGQGPSQGPGRSNGKGHEQNGDPEERDPGLARERTALAWTRTAVSFAALGGVLLKENVVTGLVVLALAPVIWQLGRVSRGQAPGAGLPEVGAPRLFLIAASIVAVALLCLAVAVFGPAVPGALAPRGRPVP
jgi:uncharacterized membrane protein YidH (DUF202 family)